MLCAQVVLDSEIEREIVTIRRTGKLAPSLLYRLGGLLHNGDEETRLRSFRLLPQLSIADPTSLSLLPLPSSSVPSTEAEMDHMRATSTLPVRPTHNIRTDKFVARDLISGATIPVVFVSFTQGAAWVK